MVWLGEDLSGSGKLNYAPMLLDGMREMIMGGFDEPEVHAAELTVGPAQIDRANGPFAASSSPSWKRQTDVFRFDQ